MEPLVFFLLLGGVLAALCSKKQQEEQSQHTSLTEEPIQDNSNPPSPRVQAPPTQRQQQTTRREEPIQDNSNPPSSKVQTRTGQGQQQATSKQYNPNPPSPKVQAPPTQRITKQFLVLVVSASQADFLESLKAKKLIDFSDGENLYEVTKYLWLGSETDFQQKRASTNPYTVSKGEESEYDIYLVYIELNQADEGFKHNVNQLDRYDAFRNLADLEVKFKISPRLQMEAYGNFDVYNR